MVIIDTSIIIDHLRQREVNATNLMLLAEKIPQQELAISVISVQELYEGQSTRLKEKEHYLFGTISPLAMLPYTYEIAQQAGEIARDLKSPIEFADAAIAATALINGAALYTLNQKHFAKIKDLELLKLLK
jgi:predicted nucleic acid-binding protein